MHVTGTPVVKGSFGLLFEQVPCVAILTTTFNLECLERREEVVNSLHQQHDNLSELTYSVRGVRNQIVQMDKSDQPVRPFQTISTRWCLKSDSQTARPSDMSADKTSSWTGNKTYKTTQSGRPSGFQTCQLVRSLVSQAIIHFRHIRPLS